MGLKKRDEETNDGALNTIDWHEHLIGQSSPKVKVQDGHISHDWNVKTGRVA